MYMQTNRIRWTISFVAAVGVLTAGCDGGGGKGETPLTDSGPDGAPDVGVSCSPSNPCVQGECGSDGFCRDKPCMTDNACPASQFCTGSTCTSECGPGRPCTGGKLCGDRGRCGAPPPDSGPPDAGPCGPGADACTTDAEPPPPCGPGSDACAVDAGDPLDARADADASVPVDAADAADADATTGSLPDADAAGGGSLVDVAPRDAEAGTPDTGPACPSGLTLCGGVCVDTRVGVPNAGSTVVEHCGSCGATVSAGAGGSVKGASAVGCINGQPAILACQVDYDDCDNDPNTGCEVHLPTGQRQWPANGFGPNGEHCGACGFACHGVGDVCVNGQCKNPSATFQCAPGWADLDNSTTNGCETNVSSDANNCGGAGVVCNTTGGCVNGACAAAAGQVACLQGYGDCDGNSANGCEVNLKTSRSHCGVCNNATSALEVCSNGIKLAWTTSATSATSHPQPIAGVHGKVDCDGNGIPETSVWTDAQNCGACGVRCSTGESCVSGTCTAASCKLPTTTPSAPSGGTFDCGSADSPDNCCASPSVPGGQFYRFYDGVTSAVPDPNSSTPRVYTEAKKFVGNIPNSYRKNYLKTSLDEFRLDRYEVTVGRFKKFVDAWRNGNWRPQPGAGKHAHLQGGGLQTSGGTESGWQSAWTTNVESTLNGLSSSQAGCTWSATAGANDGLAMNCVDWQTAAAFCAWDGGFLPSEAEWNYAAAGGGAQRVFPWSVPATKYADYVSPVDNSRAVTSDSQASGVAKPGSKSAGNARWGHADMAGNVSEWTADTYAPNTSVISGCTNCSVQDPSENRRVVRGGSWNTTIEKEPLAAYRDRFNPANLTAQYATGRENYIGFRCARAPFAAARGAICGRFRGECDADLQTVCETDLYNDENNCGSCGNVCPNDQTCLAGVCGACKFDDPDSVFDNGAIRQGCRFAQ